MPTLYRSLEPWSFPGFSGHGPEDAALNNAPLHTASQNAVSPNAAFPKTVIPNEGFRAAGQEQSGLPELPADSSGWPCYHQQNETTRAFKAYLAMRVLKPFAEHLYPDAPDPLANLSSEDMTGFVPWLCEAYRNRPDLQWSRQTYAAVRQALRPLLWKAGVSDEHMERFKHFRPENLTTYGEHKAAFRAKNVDAATMERFLAFCADPAHGEHARFAALWLRAGMACGLRPAEWRRTRIYPCPGGFVLHVPNTKYNPLLRRGNVPVRTLLFLGQANRENRADIVRFLVRLHARAERRLARGDAAGQTGWHAWAFLACPPPTLAEKEASIGLAPDAPNQEPGPANQTMAEFWAEFFAALEDEDRERLAKASWTYDPQAPFDGIGEELFASIRKSCATCLYRLNRALQGRPASFAGRYINLYTARHIFAAKVKALARANNLDDSFVAALMGHASGETAKLHYAKASLDFARGGCPLPIHSEQLKVRLKKAAAQAGRRPDNPLQSLLEDLPGDLPEDLPEDLPDAQADGWADKRPDEQPARKRTTKAAPRAGQKVDRSPGKGSRSHPLPEEDRFAYPDQDEPDWGPDQTINMFF